MKDRDKIKLKPSGVTRIGKVAQYPAAPNSINFQIKYQSNLSPKLHVQRALC